MNWRVFVAVSIWWCATTTTQCVYVDLPVTGSKCVSEHVHNNIIVHFYYVLVNLKEEASFQPGATISATVTSPYAKILYHKKNVTYDEFSFTSTETGNYVTCFWVEGNDHHADSHLTVSVEWRVGIAAEDWKSVARKENIQGVEIELLKVEGIVKAIHEKLIYLKNREAEIREVSEKTNESVARFSIMSLGVCIGASILQVLFLKRFFRKKKFIS